MSDDFGFKWAYAWLAALGLFAVTAFTVRMPLPSSPALCLGLGAIFGAIMIGPIMYVSLWRR
jgi:hypothetical protein